MSISRPVVICVPELYRGIGGIQNFSKTLIAACDEILGKPVDVLSRNDRMADLPESFRKGRVVHCAGNFPRRLRTVAFVAASLRYRNAAILATHVRLTPWLQMLTSLAHGQYLCVAHGIEVWGPWNRSLRRGIESARRILAVSEFTRQSILSHLGGTSIPVDVFPNAVDGNQFSPGPPSAALRHQLQLSDDSVVMLTVARIARSEQRKGYRRVLNLLPQLVQEFPKLVWVLAGDGDDLKQIKKDADEKGVAGHCRFSGILTDRQLPDLYRSSHFFVLPSQKEGFGIVFAEAIATGLPVIAGNQDGSLDAIDHGRLGIPVNPDDEQQLHQAIRTVIRGQIPESIRDPHFLHRECIKLFGLEAFRSRLSTQLSEAFG